MIARVFPRRTVASPTDELAFFDIPPMLGLPKISEVHVSVAFTWDISRAEWLARQWEAVGVSVSIGGPAFNEPGGDFEPGMYLKKGYVITSRGCPNRCWFCSVSKREGGIVRELPITDGWNVQDDNLLACSEGHIRRVFEMLVKQPHRPLFSGGLEAKLLKPWHAELLKASNPDSLYFAYDTPGDYEPLVNAGRTLQVAGFRLGDHALHCYVLIGFPSDTFEKAEKRLIDTIDAGFMPFAMLYRDEKGVRDPRWVSYQRSWANHIIVGTKMRQRQEAFA